MSTSPSFSPKHPIDATKAALHGERFSGVTDLRAFPRLLDVLDERASLSDVSWSAAFESRMVAGGGQQTWLHLQGSASIALKCQRCLDVMSYPLAVDLGFRFVATEGDALAEDDDCEEDLLALETPLDLGLLLEDELLMALPLVASHEVCPVAPVLSVADADFPAEAQAVNPFQALAGLKKPPPAG